MKYQFTMIIFAKIDYPDDELMFAIILKSFSDRQIQVDKKLIDFIIKRIHRSYSNIFDFIYKIDYEKRTINILPITQVTN